MIVSSNTKISRMFLCDEFLKPGATDPSTCTYQNSLSHCFSQHDSAQLMDYKISLLELSPSGLDFAMTKKLKSPTASMFC